MEYYGNKLKQFRSDYGYTQEELAEKAKCNKRTIQRLEKGEYAVSRYLALQFAEIFDTSTEDFMGSRNDSEKKTACENLEPLKIESTNTNKAHYRRQPRKKKTVAAR